MKQRQGHWVEQKYPESQDQPVKNKKDKTVSMFVWMTGFVIVPIGVIAWAAFLVGVFK